MTEANQARVAQAKAIIAEIFRDRDQSPTWEDTVEALEEIADAAISLARSIDPEYPDD